MGISSLRSLLIAAIVLSNCITWTASRHHYTHNVNGHRSRHRRQGAGLFLPASYIIPGGEGRGAWGKWSDVSPCSRTCGGGVASQKRICLEFGSDGKPLCTGGDTMYFSCQTQDCPEGAGDFRSEQCAQYDDKTFRDQKYHWVPYTKAPNQCELNCMPRGERFYYRQSPKVVDGTRCNDESFDVCVNGVCQPVGCDMMLGSKAREDKCRHCRGNGTNCHTFTGVLDSQDYRKGYNDILLIPEGATNIFIEERKSSNNYLALRAKIDNVYYLNGDYHIDFPRSLNIAGALWHYERSQQGFAAPDKLRCLGPTTEPLYLSLLLQDDNVGVSYEYSLPTALAPPPNQEYNWVHGEFSECNATCGGGIQTREVTCRSREELETVDETLCDEGLKPATQQICNTEACPPRWVEGVWSPCSKPCGDGGTRSRNVHCEKYITNEYPSVVADKECFDLLGPKPELYQECNKNATCPTWFTGPWKPCDQLCGEGKQRRVVLCHQKNNGRVELYDDSVCAGEKPATEQTCILHPCEGVDWVLTEWTGCDTCLSQVRTRAAHCATKDHKVVDASLCAYHPAPVLQEKCDKTKLPPCVTLWYATQWSECSAKCGKGIQSRRVFCGLFDGVGVTKVDDDRCDPSTKYNETKECEIPKEKCPAKWFAGPWSECTKKCDGGEQYRRVMCLSGGREVLECDERDILDSTQACNNGPCGVDEMLPLDPKSSSITDDDDRGDCIEEEDDYPEENAEAYTLVPDFGTDPDLNKDTGGSGFGETTDFSTESTVSDFSTLSSEYTSELSTDSTFSSPVTEFTNTVTEESTETDVTTETDETNGTDETTRTYETTGTDETIETDRTTETSVTEDSSKTTTTEDVITETTSSKETNFMSTDVSSTDISQSTESSESTTTSETEPTITESTEETTESSETYITETTDTESTNTETSSTEITGTTLTSDLTTEVVTDSTGTEETSSGTETKETGSTETTETGSTEITETGSTETTTEENTETTETSEITETTESTSIEISTSDLAETTEEDTATTDASVTTETGSSELSSTVSTDTTLAETTEITSEETGTTESSATESSTETSSESASSLTEETSTEVSTGESTKDESVTTESSTSESESSQTTESETSTISTEGESTDSTTSFGFSSTEISTSETSEGSTGYTTEFSTSVSTEFSTTETTESSESSPTSESSTTESNELESSTTAYPESSTYSTETTELVSGTTGLSSEGTESTESSTSTSTEDEMLTTDKSTPWIWTTVVESSPKKHKCRARKKVAKCVRSKFGCCPDRITPAAGPFDEGCPNPKTCQESKFGCCPDDVSPATGLRGAGCPVTPCNETLYGCCKSDNFTAAEGNDQEGCPEPPPPCRSSAYGCCKDDKTEATGPEKQGCPETVTETTIPETTETTETTKTPETTKGIQSCADSEFGCCYDNETDATGPNGEGCPCSISRFGCCPDGVTTAQGTNLEGCVMTCNTSAFGCCPDGVTPAHGVDMEGCCLQYPYGCCPDNYKPAEGPHLEGCDCENARFGCCPDNVTIARGPNNEGCGCEYSLFGCCPDKHTPAQGGEFEGCPCHTYQFGCCPDGVTIATGPNLQGCVCQQSKYGCCGDEVTAARGPNMDGCDCSNSKYGCCPDGVTESQGKNFLNCTDIPENRQAACALASDRGSCRNFSVYWYYDMSYGGCSRFWYGGCEGNGNRFTSKEECVDVCEQPPPKDTCNLPMVKGACAGYHVRWYYDATREQCSQFVYGGCLGNANNFDTRELCQERCEPQRTEDQCNLEVDRGPCAGNFLRWTFNTETQSCEQFLWGGCGGNSNRFGSKEACLLRCKPPGAPLQACSLPQEPGNCTEKHPAWSFSATENRCVPFYYTGCGGNDNRFNDERSCTNACPSSYEPETCTLPALIGDCAVYTARWFYDTKIRRCRQFYYGGCGGNDNNFLSERECEDSCMERVIITPATPTHAPAETTPQTTTQIHIERQTGPPRSDICYLEIDAGPCTQPRTRWAFDTASGACTQFQYGGCGGNRNNFPSEEYCAYYCSPAPATTTTAAPGNMESRFGTQDVCKQPMKTGPCDQSLMQWFYDASSDACSQFTYSGCEGNGNRFNTQEECERQCRSGPTKAPAPLTTTSTPRNDIPQEYIPEECRVSGSLQECREEGVVWYLDQARRACVQHRNEGAGAACRHDGTFPTEEACERTCGAFRDIDVCRYDVDPGPCRAAIPKVYFDYNSGRCEEFVYGGCHGGPNRFSSVEECKQVCRPNADPCNQIPETGNCLASLPMWYYNAGRDECEEFIYGGCNGNDNRRYPKFGTMIRKPGSDDEIPEKLRGTFENRSDDKFQTKEECEGRCKKASTTTVAFTSTTTTTTTAPIITPQQPLDLECETPRSLEPCGESITVYYYDTRTQACLAGDFGACRYPNSYRTEEECERKCGAFRGLDVCGSALDAGPCLTVIDKVYWDSVSGRCLNFTYGGCLGGPNRFSTVEECEEVCGNTGPDPACLRAVSTGTADCGQSSRRWYYSTASGDCQPFVYAGCDGNENNFLSYEECDLLCKRTLAEPEPERPKQPETTDGNEVLPDCDRYNEECAALRCEYAVQRTRTAGGCERCACVPVDVDCAPLRLECERLRCMYGTQRTTGSDGCERCKCFDHPCASTECVTGERCVATAYRDAITEEVRYSAECRIANKSGSCPAESARAAAEGQCRRECNDDADCLGVGKCCARGCSRLCLAPAAPTVEPPQPNTRAPELPQAPYANAEETQPEVTASEGDKATLRCVFHGNPPPKITWRRGSITIESDLGRYRLLSDGTLEIVSLYRNDSGVYICVADNGLGQASQQIHLEVADPVDMPAAIAGVPDATITGELGRPLSVRCLAYGYPPPAIYWYRGRNGPMVPYSNTLYEARGNVLLIRRLTLDTLGEYICQAYNAIGKPADWAFVVRAYRTDDVSDHPYLVPREDEVVVVTPREPSTVTTPTTVPEIEIHVFTVPVSTRLTPSRTRIPSGAEINLPCDVDGYPLPSVRWTKDGATLVADDRISLTDARLTVLRASPNDSGVYGCHASNRYSAHSSTVSITVEGLYIPANCKDNPYFATCHLIVKSKFCHHKYYSSFCCKSCVEAGQLDPNELSMQADSWTWKK